LKFLANENFPMDSVVLLRNLGYDIISVGTEFSGITDKEVLDVAKEQERTIITFDRDYGELIFKHNFRPEQGVIYLRLSLYSSEFPATAVNELLKSPDFSTVRRLTVFDGVTIRQRQY
jgi:predicted nuclease of predicted toxin-antitoxin system